MYADLERDYEVKASKLMGTSTPADVAKALMKAIERDDPEVIVNPSPLRPGLATLTLFPKLGEKAIRVLGINKAAEQASRARRAKKEEES